MSAALPQLRMAAHDDTVEVLVGYWVTHHDGSAAFIRGDRTRAENYLITHRGVRIEPVYVRRSAIRCLQGAATVESPFRLKVGIVGCFSGCKPAQRDALAVNPDPGLPQLPGATP